MTAYGISAFVAHRDIEPTKEWQSEIELALNTADALCALLHPAFHESKWTDQEVGFAMGRQLLIIPVRLGIDPYGFIGKSQALNGTGKTALSLAHEIFQVLSTHKQTAERLAEAVVARFEGAESYRSAKEAVALLEGLPSLRPSLRARLEGASANNVQVREAFGVPERIAALVSRLSGTA
jgi:hypothetical protein